MANKIICIAREFGSGGREIAEKLGERLDLKVYDKEILQMACSYGGVRSRLLERSDERTTNPYLYTTVHEGNRHVRMGRSTEEVLFSLQKHEIRRIAAQENCIFVGRCADYVLKDSGAKLLRVFISAPPDQRIARKMEQEAWSYRKGKRMVMRTDAQRRKYYEHNTGQTWGIGGCYDLFLDTGEITIEDAVAEIAEHYSKL